jgi:hypothetical protein
LRPPFGKNKEERRRMLQNAKHIPFLSIKESVFFAETKRAKKAETPVGISAKPEISNWYWSTVIPQIAD